MRDAIIVNIVRIPGGEGKPGGSLSHLHPLNLLATTLGELIRRTGLEPELVEDIIGGCVTRVGVQSANVTHNAVRVCR